VVERDEDLSRRRISVQGGYQRIALPQHDSLINRTFVCDFAEVNWQRFQHYHGAFCVPRARRIRTGVRSQSCDNSVGDGVTS
jgi:hypothetical protein